MTIVEKVTEVINDYVSDNGTFAEMNTDQIFELVNSVYPINKSSLLPSDFCYNRTNEGIDFEKHIHLFERLENGLYRLLGEDYPYTGPVYFRRKGETVDRICGHWSSGSYIKGSSNIESRLEDLFESLTVVLKAAEISKNDATVSASVDSKELCSFVVMDEAYKVCTGILEWNTKTTYLSSLVENECVYYVETIDECIGEALRIFDFTTNQNKDPHRLAIEKIIEKIAKDIPGVTYVKNNVKSTPVDKNGERILDIYYRKDAIRINVKTNSEAYEIYEKELPKDICYQKDSASPYSTSGVFAFFVNDDNVEFVLRKILSGVSTGTGESELRKTVTAVAFEKAYAHFIEQADRNVESKKAQGSKVPYGFNEKPECDGAQFKAQYGQGAPSAAPYMNWWVVSIYYLPSNGNIIMGIEEDRYPHLKEMQIKPLRYEQLGNKKVNAAVFYSAHKTYVNYGELYEKFIQVCEEVMRLGLK